MSRFAYAPILAVALWSSLGCEEKGAATLAPSASSLGPAAPAAQSAVPLRIERATSAVKFLMDSPLEKIDGDAPQSVSGELFVDPTDLTKSTGLVKIDLRQLTLYQQKRRDESEQYGERKKSDLQNEHARDWLQIAPKEGEVTADQAEMNRWVEFKVDKLETATPNVAAQNGPEREVAATVSGDFRLHGRKSRKSAKIELLFKYTGNKLDSVQVKSVEPVAVSLDEFEVHPRDGAGKLVKTVTEAIASNLKGKVKNQAPVAFEFAAKPR